MKRREVIKKTAAMMGMTILGAEFFLSGCTGRENQKSLFSIKDIALMDEIGETILPDSDRSPGAKAAQIGVFMKNFVINCYSNSDQEVFLLGLNEINNISRERFDKYFLNISNQQKFDLLSDIDKQAKNQKDVHLLHFFTMMKQITILGYFSSEIGVTQAMRYNPLPGQYNGCYPYKDGDKAWYGYLSSIG